MAYLVAFFLSIFAPSTDGVLQQQYVEREPTNGYWYNRCVYVQPVTFDTFNHDSEGWRTEAIARQDACPTTLDY
jgi:hypothetical protein